MRNDDGFLLIELMVALFLFMALVCAVLSGQAAVVVMHSEIMARAGMMATFTKVIEAGDRGAGRARPTQGYLVDCWVVDCSPYHRHSDVAVSLHTITITQQGPGSKKSQLGCSMQTVGWIYE